MSSESTEQAKPQISEGGIDQSVVKGSPETVFFLLCSKNNILNAINPDDASDYLKGHSSVKLYRFGGGAAIGALASMFASKAIPFTGFKKGFIVTALTVFGAQLGISLANHAPVVQKKQLEMDSIMFKYNDVLRNQDMMKKLEKELYDRK